MGTSAAHWSNRCAICKQCGMDGATRSSKSWFDLVSFPGGSGNETRFDHDHTIKRSRWISWPMATRSFTSQINNAAC